MTNENKSESTSENKLLEKNKKKVKNVTNLKCGRFDCNISAKHHVAVNSGKWILLCEKHWNEHEVKNGKKK